VREGGGAGLGRRTRAEGRVAERRTRGGAGCGGRAEARGGEGVVVRAEGGRMGRTCGRAEKRSTKFLSRLCTF
jgi:hypothetical protein